MALISSEKNCLPIRFACEVNSDHIFFHLQGQFLSMLWREGVVHRNIQGRTTGLVGPGYLK